MNKRHLHHFWKSFRHISPWYFVAAAIISGAVGVFALRANYAHMVTLKNAVYSADQNNGDVEGALQALQAFVTHHMNTSLSTGNTSIYPPIQLKYTYDRLVQAESQKAAAQNSQYLHIYTDAQHYCEAKIPHGFSGGYRVSCIQQYVEAHGITNTVALTPIPASLYEFDFVSPRWSPDLAGLSLALAVVCGLLAGGLFIAQWLLRRAVR